MAEDNRCPRCDCWRPICRCDGNKGPGMHVWKPMWYRDICEKPLYIESKRQLKEECKKHNVVACRLM